MKRDRPSVLMVAYTDYASDPRVIREAEAALSAGFAVDFLALRRQGDRNIELVRGVRVFHLNQRRYRGGGHVNYLFAYLQFFVRCFFKATWLFFKNRYAVIHVNNMPDFLVFCSLIPKICGAKIILDIHDPMPNTFASKFGENHYGFFYHLLLWQERLSAWYADKTLTVHEPVKHGILVKHGLNPDSIQVVANFADDELFPLQDSYSIDGKLRLVFHGTILERYGLGNVVLAVSRLKRRENISVRIIGEGDFSTELSKMIAALGLHETVHFLNCVYPLPEIPLLISDCNLGLVPLEMSSATNYGLPLKLLEYTSLGLPSLTIRNAAISYYFGQDDCLFYDPEDADSLRRVFESLADNPEILLRYRQRAIALREKFRWSVEKQKYISILHELCNEPGVTPVAATAGLNSP